MAPRPEVALTVRLPGVVMTGGVKLVSSALARRVISSTRASPASERASRARLESISFQWRKARSSMLGGEVEVAPSALQHEGVFLAIQRADVGPAGQDRLLAGEDDLAGKLVSRLAAGRMKVSWKPLRSSRKPDVLAAEIFGFADVFRRERGVPEHLVACPRRPSDGWSRHDPIWRVRPAFRSASTRTARFLAPP